MATTTPQLHGRCVADAALGHPERVCVGCFDLAEKQTGETSAFALAKWIASQEVTTR